ncbi:unnamed protein product [Symbiodinium necroappetens]|uniref:Uncharacterized protein n=1 Tax=Symbiodinium necroappetens TaxID=1628268 RepID=A0A812JE18_9DINO|nr:unnamed protein product [Symbiodinium necroappetens]
MLALWALVSAISAQVSLIPDSVSESSNTMSLAHTGWTAVLFLVFNICIAEEGCQDGKCPASAASAASAASLLALKAEVHSALAGNLSEFPINMSVNSSNGTVNEELLTILGMNAEQDLKAMSNVPNPENTSNSTDGRHGLGELGRNLEFLMLKIVQLETVVELQQHEIQDLRDIVKDHLDLDHDNNAVSMKQVDPAARQQKADETLRSVMQKHNHQREHRDFKPQALRQKDKEEQQKVHSKHDQQRKQKKQEPQGALLEEDTSEAVRRLIPNPLDWVEDAVDTVTDTANSAAKAVANTAEDVVNGVSDGANLVGDALGDAYDSASDQVAFVANTVIDTVERAVDILVRGFDDWSAGCPDTTWPSLSVDSNGMHVNWGRQKCYVQLMGQRCDLFDFNFSTLNVNWPGPIKAMVNLGNDLVQCATSGNALEVIKCLGLQLLQVVPPLSFLTKMGDMLTEFIDVFAQVATFVVKQVLSESTTLIQQAAESTFPAVDATPVVHHAGRSLTIKTHSQHRKHSRSKLPRQEDKGGQGGQGMSAVQQDAQRGKRAKRGDDDSDPQGVVALSVSDQSGNYATRLITQWNGKETDTNSCLAFAPKSKTGSNDQATKGDWQGSSADAFIPLEPFGVPCDNDWMKANWDRWQGYSFYTWEMSIEKCVTVTFSLGMQPVIAFVGGLNFELMPAPLAELDTTVCWPDKQPDGVDLSVLQSKIRSGGVMLFSRTLRLQKRFGASTDFVGSNTFGAHESWRNPLGTAVGSHSGEDDRTVETMSRSQSLLETNRSSEESSKSQSSTMAELRWETDLEDLYMAAIDYGRDFGINKTSELRGQDVLKRVKEMKARKAMSGLQTEAEAGSAESSIHQLFSFRNPGMVNFEIQGLLEDNSLELGMKINFGPFESPQKRIQLLNIAHQFSLVLAAMPWVSASSKAKAIASLTGFGDNDVGQVTPVVPPIAPGSIMAFYSPYHSRYLRMNDNADIDRSGSCSYDDPLPASWTWEKFAVVDAGNGLIALHSPKFNRFVKMTATGDLIAGPYKAASQLPDEWTDLKFRVVEAGKGEVALHSPLRNRIIRMNDVGVDTFEWNVTALPDTMTWPRFHLKRSFWLLQPGTVVGLFSTVFDTYVLMDPDGNINPSQPSSFWHTFNLDSFRGGFTVVDAGNGEVALHHTLANRFVTMTGDLIGSPEKAAHELPPPKEWPEVRFAVVDAGEGQVALYNPHHDRYVVMSHTDVTVSPPSAPQDFDNWMTWRRFKVKLLADVAPNDLAWSYS